VSDPRACTCEDYEREDPDDTLCFVCVCGHLQEEHGTGFFRRCKFTPEPEDEGDE
jgi:hypothetical protein